MSTFEEVYDRLVVVSLVWTDNLSEPDRAGKEHWQERIGLHASPTFDSSALACASVRLPCFISICRKSSSDTKCEWPI